MPGVVRMGDNCSGHDACPPRPPATYSDTVYVDGKPVVRFGDTLENHGCPDHTPHSGVYLGDNTVYADGRPIQIQGHPISCGSHCQQCSDTVFIG